jgi:DNA-directed RNA polymerase subunit RPC12/RpoP
MFVLSMLLPVARVSKTKPNIKFIIINFRFQRNLSRHHTLIHPHIKHRSILPGSKSRPTATIVKSPTPDPQEEVEEEEEEEFVDPMIPEISYENGESLEQSYDDQDQEQDQYWNQEESMSNSEDVTNYEFANQKLYTCQDCGKTFDKMNRYKLHITVHSNVKPYHCGKCGQNFRLPGILATHVKV